MSSKFSLESQMTKDDMETIESIFSRTKKDDELEIMFFNYRQDKNPMGLDVFMKLRNFIRFRSKKDKLKLIIDKSLDIAYSEPVTNNSYRLSINGLDNVNKYLKISHQLNEHVIFKLIMNRFIEKSEGITFIKKVKDAKNIHNVDEFNFRIRMSNELPVTGEEIDKLEKMDKQSLNNIKFRYKERISLVLHDDKDYMIRIDLTSVKTSRNVNNINDKPSSYELEIEYQTKTKTKKEHFAHLLKETETLLKLIEQSPHLMPESEKMMVIDNYSSLLGISKEKNISLAGRQPQSLEIQHITDMLPDKYAVTDKADGDRYFLVIFNGRVYLISNNLYVKNTGIVLNKDKADKYNNSVLDGELIFIVKEKRYIFMAFDCLFNGGKDIRDIQTFMTRLNEADDIIENCFLLGKQKGYKVKEYTGTFNADKRAEHFGGEIKNFMRILNDDMKLEKEYVMIRRKLFINVLGGRRNEIYKYSKLLWDKYIFDSSVQCPYILDGLVYHPLEQKYVIGKTTTYIEYKWKPSDKNSIDFYVEYERSPDTGNIIILYDNSNDENIQNKPYKIINLYVGKREKGVEIPTLFRKDDGGYKAYLFLDGTEVRDIEGNIVQDKTVVEFYYNNDDTIDPKFRWVPMRTRYDKTQAVHKYKKRYGNYIDVANKVWRSIINPITINDFNILSDDKMFESHLASINKKITHSLIKSEREENVYYELQTKMVEPMRNFHNYIKSIIIYTYCSFAYNKGQKLSVLDFGCGRGGDIMKFYYPRVDSYVGIDYDYNNLHDATDGALSRYRQMSYKKANFPKMFFIHADGGTLLDENEQRKSIGTLSGKDRGLMKKFFSLEASKRTTFDIINCQFAVHYFLKNDIVWGNFTKNIDMYLREGGYALFTTFDAETVNEAFKGSDTYQIHFTNNKGEKVLLIELLKKYEKIDFTKPVGTGHPIDVLNATFSTKYITEYLVHKDFFIKELEEKCGLELIETNMFENIYYMHQDYFKSVVETETIPGTRKFLEKVARFYDMTNDENKAGFQMSRLNRYFIFRRKSTTKQAQKGGSLISYLNEKMEEPLTNIEYLIGGDYYLRTGVQAPNYSFADSLCTLLKEESIIPEKTEVQEFIDTFKLNDLTDNKINSSAIKNVGKNMEIIHDIDGKQITKLDGMNIIILEEDCDKDVNIQSALISKSENKYNKSPFGIIYQRNGMFHPVIKKKDNKNYGLFKGTSKAIKNLLDEE